MQKFMKCSLERGILNVFASLLLSLAMLAAAPAAAPTEGTAAPLPATAADRPVAVARPVAAKADPDRIICRRVGIPNSRFTTKNCATAAEWEANARSSRRYTRDIQTAPSACRAAGC